MPDPVKPKFSLGRLLTTPNALGRVNQEDALRCLGRHVTGDWGDVDERDHAENEFALGRVLRIFSVYHDRHGTKFWIITEADRSATTILLPEDY